MRVGIAIEDTWSFFHEIYADLSAHHQTSLFERRRLAAPFLRERIDRQLYRRDLDDFLGRQDVVFFEWASGLLAAASHRPKRCALVTRLHRFELYQWADQVNWDAVDRIILVSAAKQREFSRRFPDHSHKTIVIPEAISLRKFRSQPRTFSGNLGTLCHLSPRKRVYELILAFYELSRQRADLHLHIGGGPRPSAGDYAEALHYLVDSLGLGERITFHAHVDKPEEWYANIDIYISNSFSEGLQLAPMEAIGAGSYCFSHRWAGAEELLPEANLYYTDAELVQKVNAYCALSEVERQVEKDRLQALICERFDIDKTKIQIRQVVEEAAARYHSPNGGRP